MQANVWWLYMIECGHGIYVGISKDVSRRYKEHVAGRGSKYTKINKPVRLLVSVKIGNYAVARKIENKFKKFTHLEKRRWANVLGTNVDSADFPVSIFLGDIDDHSN